MCMYDRLDFIERYCSRLSVNSELTKVCKFIAMRIESNNIIPENTPHSVAAGIIYFVVQVCHLNISKRAVNKISKISEVTINKCYKKLDKIKERLVPSPRGRSWCASGRRPAPEPATAHSSGSFSSAL